LQLINQGGPQNGSSPLTNYQEISWTAATVGSFPITYYQIYRNGVAYDTTTGTSYTDTNASRSNDPTWSTGATIYSYQVAAVDTQGNVGPQAAQMSVYSYQNGKSNWGNSDLSWGTIDENYASTAGNPQGGPFDISVDFIAGGFQPTANAPQSPLWDLEIGAFNYFTIDVNPGPIMDYVLNLGTVSRVPPGDVFGWHPAVNVFNYGPAPMANTWATYRIPLTDLGMGICQFTGSISGTTLTVTGITQGQPLVDNAGFVTGPGVPSGTYIVASAQNSAIGTFTVAGPGISSSSSVPTTTMTYQRTSLYKFGIFPSVNQTQMYFNNIGWTTSGAGTGGTPAPTVTLTASPTSITSGSSSTLSWSSTNATSCAASGGWTGAETTSGTSTVKPTSTTTYALTCMGTGGTANASAIVTVSASALITPAVTVTPVSTTIPFGQSLSVTISVSGGSGNPTPTGSIVLSSGTYASSPTTLTSGSATIVVPAGSLAVGTDELTAVYTPDAASSAIYSSASGTSSVTVTAASSGITVSINTLANRHVISSFIYGGAYPQDANHVTDSGTTFVRWGGDATSTYNWQLGTNNAANDYYYEDYTSAGFSNGDDASSTQFITDVENAGSHPLMTMVMLPWVAQSPETSVTQGGTDNYHWSFSVAQFGKQCSTDYWNSDAGDGLETDCQTPVTTNAATTAYYPLLDDSTQTCNASTCVYRNAWAAALATAFGSETCSIPYSTITSCHFYDMDNEIEIWGTTHRDIHPTPSGYDELANVYLAEAAKLKTWDPQAVRFGPITCCWWFYWNGANGSDKAAHGGVDFVPWWLNQVYWNDQINGTRTLDVFDLHAYPDANTSGLSQTQLQALAANIYRDYWDPTFVSPSSSIDQVWTTNIQPNRTIPFRIPRMRAIVNMIYPGTPMSFTEWSAAFAGESDFSTAMGDADAYGIFGRERLTFASRWEAPLPTNPNYLALKLYTNYDGGHHGFGTTSVSAVNTGNPALFSSYAALDSTGKVLTVMVLNKDPNNTAQVEFDLSGFNATSFVSYTLASTASNSIKASTSQAWTSSQSFAPYTATLLVITGALATTPVSDWDLNPDAIMVPAGGTVTLQPKITGGTANVTLSSAVLDSYESVSACGGTPVITAATLTPAQPGAITVNAGTTPGFCHFTVTGSDGTATQTEGGWIVVGNPPATLSQTGDGQSGAHGQALTDPLTVTLLPGQSGGASTGASILFTTSAGSLSNGTTSGTSVIAVTNSSGVASVTLTLPASTGKVTVQAQAPIALGATEISFTETSQ
jgi:hypothetical protein